LHCISEMPGVDHIRSLTVTEIPDRRGDEKTLALVYAGRLDIAVVASDA
jgi:hypothetical protein